MPTFRDWIAGRTAETAIQDDDEFYLRDDSGDVSKRVTYAGLKTALASQFGTRAAIYLPGVAGNYIETPDHASFDVAGDLWLGAKVMRPDWINADQPIIACRDDLGANFNFRFYVSSTGTLVLLWKDGASTRTTQSTVAVSFADGEAGWVWVLVDIDNGAGQYDVKFYTGETPVQLGATVTGATGVATLPATAGAIRLGEVASFDPWTGQVQRFVMRDGGSGGTLVADYDATVAATRYRDSTGKVWTVTGSSWSHQAAV